ncbi:protein FAM186B [Perognathus longimembris pacificus]|uniref:protein FAM186B n=1 Tax=Perognathus longimembris pacificus TaxID=214514 RepID=UPI0020194483|nr:protein FAM186B [Perognathus longimembris pacificus]
MEDNSPHLVTPASVKAILSRIETAQLTRVQEGISNQLSDILGNVKSVINRFQEELGYDIKEKAIIHNAGQTGKKRHILLKKIASFSQDAKVKERHLYDILCWLSDWGGSLTYELKQSEEEEEALDEWIEVMEKVLPLSLVTTKGGIESLISLCSTLIEDQKKKARMSKHIFWKDWIEKSSQKSAQHPQPLSPEQMLQDNHITNTKVSEVTAMLQELLDSTMFNNREAGAIRYMVTVVENLNKALILQQEENKSLETKYRYLKTEMTKELTNQKLCFQKSTETLESKRNALLKQVEILGKKYHELLLTKHDLEFQLKQAQIAIDQAKVQKKVFLIPFELPEKDALLKKEKAMEETDLELQEGEKYLASLLSPPPVTSAWDSEGTSSTQSLSTMSPELRIADIFSGKDTGNLVPLSEEDFPTEDERLVAEGPGPEDRDQEDHFQEKRTQMRSHLSPESVEREAERREEEFIWERRRQQWLQEEERWLQRQRKWTLQELEHHNRLRQWEMEAAARQQQQQKSSGPEDEPKEDRRIFITTNRWRNLEKAERSTVPPARRAQSARQGKRPQAPGTPHTPPRGLGNQRAVSAAELTRTSKPSQVPTRPKKAASFPITGTSIRRVTRPSMQRSVIPKEKVYHMNMEAQRENLQLLRGHSELALPNYLRSKALLLITTTMDLSSARLQCLCQKYILYRHFQSLRQEVTNHIQILRELRTPYKIHSFYILLENIEHQQNLGLQTWTDRQKDLEAKRKECLNSMVTMFPKLQLEWNIHLNIPEVTSPKPRKCKSSSVPRPQCARSSGPMCKQPSLSKHRECTPLWMASQQGNQMDAIWKTDVASSSYPIEKKIPASQAWDQVGGHPDIPRLLARDEQASYQKDHSKPGLNSCRASMTQQRECQKPTLELAEFVSKKSTKLLLGTPQSQKNQDTASVPTPSLN